MELKPQYKQIKFNKEAYLAELHKYFVEQITQAAQLWLQAITGHIIPVWSGASMQTFHPLAKEAGFALSKGTSTPAGSYLKSSRLALTFDPKGGLITVGEKGQYFFFYESKLPHLTYNEYHNANAEKDPTVFYRLTRPGPYNFQLRGQEVFRFFSENVSLPDPMAHITEEAL